MSNNKGLYSFIKFLLVIILFISLGIILVKSDTRGSTEASAYEPEDISHVQNLDMIVIDNDGYKKDRKGPVIFPHKDHAKEYKLSCWDCHHEYRDGENIWSPWGITKKCRECHDPITKKDNLIKLQTAYHLNCKTCHEKLKIFGDDPLVYRKCNKCHEETK